MTQRQRFAKNGIAFKNGLNRDLFSDNLAAEWRAPFWLKPIYRPLANVGKKPFGKEHRTRAIGPRDVPHGPQTRKDRDTIRPNDDITARLYHRNACAMFQRKARQDVAQKSCVGDFRRGGQGKISVLRMHANGQ